MYENIDQLACCCIDDNYDMTKGPQIFAECGIMNRAAKFACFCKMSTFSQNVAEFGTG